jgi:hypothetical protein
MTAGERVAAEVAAVEKRARAHEHRVWAMERERSHLQTEAIASHYTVHCPVVVNPFTPSPGDGGSCQGSAGSFLIAVSSFYAPLVPPTIRLKLPPPLALHPLAVGGTQIDRRVTVFEVFASAAAAASVPPFQASLDHSVAGKVDRLKDTGSMPAGRRSTRLVGLSVSAASASAAALPSLAPPRVRSSPLSLSRGAHLTPGTTPRVSRQHRQQQVRQQPPLIILL